MGLEHLAEHRDFMSPLKGAAASIVFFLLIRRGISYTARELAYVCKYSDKPTTEALAYLQSKKWVQFNGHLNGYSIPMNFQLPLPLEQIAAGVAQLDAGTNRTAQPGAAGHVALLDVGGDDNSEGELIGIFPNDRNFSDHSSPSSSFVFIDHKDQEDEEERSPDDRNFSDIRTMLVSAGVGSRSPVLRELLKLDLDPVYVQAHIQAREAALEQNQYYPVSHLITKLRCGDPAPAPPRNPLKQQIPDSLRDIIKR